MRSFVHALVIAAAVAIALHYSMILEQPYSATLVRLYELPLWRLLLVVLAVSAFLWSVPVGVIVALIIFFYMSEMNALLQPFVNGPGAEGAGGAGGSGVPERDIQTLTRGDLRREKVMP